MDSVSGLVSIITPAYNAAPYLEETIASVRAQTHREWEWLFADDGSTDETLGIMERAAGLDQRIRVIPAEGHKGSAAAARNRAMRMARGEFLAFLDADDLWDPEKTRIQVAYLHRHSFVDGVTCGYDLFGDPVRVSTDHRLSREEVVVQWSEVLSGAPFPTPSFLFRRRCYEAMGGMDEDPRLVTGEDYEFFARFLATYTVHRICNNLLHVRMSAPMGSLTARQQTGKGVKGLPVMEILLEKGLINQRQARHMESRMYYTQATDNLFRHRVPFRGLLLRSLLTGGAPGRAWVMFILSVLPAVLLKPLLARLQRLRGRSVRRADAE